MKWLTASSRLTNYRKPQLADVDGTLNDSGVVVLRYLNFPRPPLALPPPDVVGEVPVLLTHIRIQRVKHPCRRTALT